MRLSYSLDYDDFFQYSLFNAAKSKRIRSQRRKSWIIFGLAMAVLAVLTNHEKGVRALVFSVVFALVLTGLYPFYQAYYYKSHYRKSVADLCKGKVGVVSTLIFNSDSMQMTDETGETIIYFTHLAEINEIRDFIFVKFKTGESLIIPKKKISDLNALNQRLTEISENFHIPRNVELNWKWK